MSQEPVSPGRRSGPPDNPGRQVEDDALRRSRILDPFRFAEGPEIACTTLAEGPWGIETQKDADSVTMPLRRLVDQAEGVDAFVIACYRTWRAVLQPERAALGWW